MVRHITSLMLLAVGIAIVTIAIFLFVQSAQMTKGNFSEDTLFAQMVLHDVLAREAIPNGIDPKSIAGPLYKRIFLYGIPGVILIGLACWQLLTTGHCTSTVSHSAH